MVGVLDHCISVECNAHARVGSVLNECQGMLWSHHREPVVTLGVGLFRVETVWHRPPGEHNGYISSGVPHDNELFRKI